MQGVHPLDSHDATSPFQFPIPSLSAAPLFNVVRGENFEIKDACMSFRAS